ncbi:hypothetical protein SAY87_013126 [Trapa incisa]|uniref:Uncharacterized protein n=1 Tax=Trapa incisa TaxID=236973 RepID=A0AAN7KFU7_9MYRT|nr:hypothetical protein SAY87_013126 [Trapa incisa]
MHCATVSCRTPFSPSHFPHIEFKAASIHSIPAEIKRDQLPSHDQISQGRREAKHEEVAPKDDEGGGRSTTPAVFRPNEGEEAADSDPQRQGAASRPALLKDGGLHLAVEVASECPTCTFQDLPPLIICRKFRCFR